MSGKPKSTILEKYHRAISSLPLEEQIERAKKIKSPKTLRRFLSEESPDQLVARFSHRLKEVKGLGFSSYELGRIECSGKYRVRPVELMEYFIKNPNDARSLAKLAELGTEAGILARNEQLREKTLDVAMAAIMAAIGKTDNPPTDKGLRSKLYHQMGRICFAMGNETNGAEFFDNAVANSATPDIARKLTQGEIFLWSDKYEEAKKLLEPLAEQGDGKAIGLLCGNSDREGRLHDRCRYLKLDIQFGHTSSYIPLGQAQKYLGNTEEAAHSYRMAIKAGHPEAVGYLSTLLMEEGNMPGAKAECEKVIEAGHPLGYVTLAQLMAHEKNDAACAENFRKALDGGAVMSPYAEGVITVIENKIERAERYCLKHAGKDPRLHYILTRIYEYVKRNGKKALKHALLARKLCHTEELHEVLEDVLEAGEDFVPVEDELRTALFGDKGTLEHWLAAYLDQWLLKKINVDMN